MKHDFVRGFVISDIVFGCGNPTYNPSPVQELCLLTQFSVSFFCSIGVVVFTLFAFLLLLLFWFVYFLVCLLILLLLCLFP